MGFLKKWFGKKETAVKKEFTAEEEERDYELKSAALEAVLGPMYPMVGHAIIPFAIGGAVDMYYFLKHIPGTGFATMELLDPAGQGPKPNRIGTYELVAFTKHALVENRETPSPFNLIERKACGFLTAIGSYASQAVLNPKETIEIPNGDQEENTCLVLDLYQPNEKQFKIGERQHHLLLCLQVFRAEMEFARQNGTDALLNILKEKGFYPYSDLDRDPVV